MSASRLILLVDDDRDLLTALSGGLRQRGYEVAVAPDAVAAMSAAVRLKPGVVVLDVGLPGGEGTVVMKRMHALPQLAGVPVIMISGRDPRQYREEALAAGASAYLGKPIEVDDLVLAIRVALGEDIGLDAAAAKGGVASGRLGDILKDMGLVTDQQIASALARQSEVASASAAFADKVIMLVDDDEDLLVALAAPLRRQGFDVTVATDAVTAISTAVKQPPDVIIMDIGLPGGDGVTVMGRLHSLPQLAGVPVIMLSGRDADKHRGDALAAGAAAYLVKPIGPEALTAAVVKALGEDTASS
ncbi:MAG TPA: response regulator [Thermoleophilia bacterium]